jgi:hypothetical protein
MGNMKEVFMLFIKIVKPGWLANRDPTLQDYWQRPAPTIYTLLVSTKIKEYPKSPQRTHLWYETSTGVLYTGCCVVRAGYDKPSSRAGLIG